MLKKFLILVRSRKGTFVMIAVACALVTGAIIVGVGDSIPGILLCYLATTVLAVALTHTWQEVKKFLILLGASFAGFFLFAFLHNVFYGLGEVTSQITALSSLLEFFNVIFFIIAIFLCPVGFLVGAGGNIVLFIKRRRR